MTSRTRLLVLGISTPVIAFAVIGGFLGQAMTRDDTYQHLRVFEDVVSLVLNNYVEEVDVSDAMRGAMNGLTDGLDADSGYLAPELVQAYEQNAPLPAGDTGIVLTRQYYLRIVSVREGSPAARAGLRLGDYVRAIDNRATKDMSVFEGTRLLRGTPGSTVSLLVIRGNAADPHVVELTRERASGPDVTSRMAGGSVGYLKVHALTNEAPAALRDSLTRLARTGATRYVVDLRGAASGELDNGIAAARLFVGSGTLAIREPKTGERQVIEAAAGDGAITAPVVLVVDSGTSGAAEIMAAALDGADRAELVGSRTLGRAARQRLVKLPDGSGLLLSYERFLTPGSDEPLHERGLAPDVEVDVPEVEFGTVPPPGDPTLDRAIEVVTAQAAAA
ncbi:MAG: S41 family peptidase [Vicinamibacterales bacterium]